MGEHLFISYATEDSDLAEWLSLKLTGEGYAVWCDRYKLLGGESYPRDIDEAIKTKTFRVIALLSRASRDKPNPRKERTLALNIGKERGVDFLIPVNVDGLKPTELDWMTSDITFIPFHKSWAKGLAQLLKKLDSIDAPRPVKNGKAIACNIYLNRLTIEEEPEILYSNCLEFLKIPDMIKEFRFKQPLSKNEIEILSQRWAFYTKDPQAVFSFCSPPDSDLFQCQHTNSYGWGEQSQILGISSENIVSNLLRRSLEVKCLQNRLRKSEIGSIYFPFSLLEDNKLHFTGYKGKTTWMLVAGERHTPSHFKYHISPSFKIRREPDSYVAELIINLYLTDPSGEPLESKSAHTRHKAVRKNWWNNHFLNRSLAICELLSDESGNIIMGEDEEEIILSGKFNSFESPIKIDESKLGDLPEDEVEDNIELFEEEEVED
jgi:hypothetical protein